MPDQCRPLVVVVVVGRRYALSHAGRRRGRTTTLLGTAPSPTPRLLIWTPAFCSMWQLFPIPFPLLA